MFLSFMLYLIHITNDYYTDISTYRQLAYDMYIQCIYYYAMYYLHVIQYYSTIHVLQTTDDKGEESVGVRRRKEDKKPQEEEVEETEFQTVRKSPR